MKDLDAKDTYTRMFFKFNEKEIELLSRRQSWVRSYVNEEMHTHLAKHGIYITRALKVS